MMNLFKAQEQLRDVSKDQLVQMMQQPPGEVPPFLIMTELQRRTRAEKEAALNQGPPETTVAQDAVNAAGMPQPGLAGMAQAMAPQTDMTGNTSAMGAQQAPMQQAPVRAMREGGLAGVSSNLQDFSAMNPSGNAAVPRLITRTSGQFVELPDGSLVPLSALGFDQTSSTPTPRGFSMDLGPTATQADLDQRQRDRDVSMQSSRPMPQPAFMDTALDDITLPGDDGRMRRSIQHLYRPSESDRGLGNTARIPDLIDVRDEASPLSEMPGLSFDPRQDYVPPTRPDIRPYVQPTIGATELNTPSMRNALAANRPSVEGGGISDLLEAVSVPPQPGRERGRGSSGVDTSIEDAPRGDRSRGGGDRGAETGMDWEKFFFPLRGTPGADQPEYPPDAFTLERRTPTAVPALDEPAPADPALEAPAVDAAPAPAPATAQPATSGGGGGGGSSSAMAAASASAPMDDNERLLTQDKWLALARFGAALGASRAPTFGMAIGEAGNVALDSLGQARAAYQERKAAAEAMALQRQALALRAAGGGGGGSGGGNPSFYEMSAGQARVLEDLGNQIAALEMRRAGMDEGGWLSGPNGAILDIENQLDALRAEREMAFRYMIGVPRAQETVLDTIDVQE